MTQDASFTNPDVQRCPFPLIRHMHNQAPVYVDPVTGFYVIARYDDIAHVNAHPEIFSNKTSIVIGGDDSPGAREASALFKAEGYVRIHTLVTNDPPSHTMFRSIVDRVFTASYVKSLEPYIEEIANTLIDGFVADGRVDLLRDFCIRLPMYVIADQLGAPREDWETFKLWSDNAISLINPALSPDERLERTRIHIDMQRFLAAKHAEYLDHPSDNLLGRLAVAEVEGRRLTIQEYVNVGDQLLVAGNETTTSGIGHAINMLIRQPELMAELQAKPARINAFVEEVLRLHAPSPHLYRQVIADGVELSGVAIPKGAIAMLSYLAGNYDPVRFANPEAVDLDRKGLRNHLGFGRGAHYCIGNLLARAEMRIAIDRLILRLPDLRFDPDYPEPRLAEYYHVHTLENLNVRFTPSRPEEGGA